MKIYLARHGETGWSSKGIIQTHSDGPDNKLTEKGMAEGHDIGQILSSQPIKRVYHSPKERAQQTAYIISSYLTNPEICKDDRLRDNDLGIIDGLTMQQFADLYPKEYRARRDDPLFYRLPKEFGVNGNRPESMWDTILRSNSLLKEIIMKGDDACIVGHRSVNIGIICQLCYGSQVKIQDADLNRIATPTYAVYQFSVDDVVKPVEHNQGKGWTPGLILE